MSTETNKHIVFEVMEKGFNQGDLSVVEKYTATEAIDHQEPLGTEFIAHLKEVIVTLRTAFPDLHFEIHNVVAEGDIVAFRSTMTGTHLGELRVAGMGVFKAGPKVLPPTGRQISVPHMHFLRVVNGKTFDLWHIMDTMAMLGQLGAIPQPNPA